MNTPYVKEYNENGELLNPIKGKYASSNPNRSNRRLIHKKDRFKSNKKGQSMTVLVRDRYLKRTQLITFLNEETERIERRKIFHYDLPKNRKKKQTSKDDKDV